MTLKMKDNVVMIGPPVDGRGGMSSVAAAYRHDGLFERYNVVYLSPVAEGHLVGKLFAALSALVRYLGMLLGGRIGLVHIHVASSISFWRKSVFALSAYAFGRPVILHMHGGNFVEFFSGTPALGRKFIKWLFKRADRVVVLSATWIDRFQEIVPASHCVAIENPVVPPSGDAPSRGNRGVVTFLFLGRLEKDKGAYDLLSAFAKITDDFSQVRLVMGGIGELGECEQLANALGLSEKVVFPGWIVGAEKQHWFDEADVFVLPSHIEGLPISMLEAMSNGLPVVICPVGSIPETISDQVEALFVPVGEVSALSAAMLHLARSPALRFEMGQHGLRTFAERYSVGSVVPRVEALYDELLGNPAAKSREMRGVA
jgi:glycosyltransferase involved in cell wall biosynthesis